MTSLLILLKHRCPWLWRAVERANGWLFALRYPDFDRQAAATLRSCATADYDLAPVAAADLAALSDFLMRQPARRLTHFDPHAFDPATLGRLHRNRAFAMMRLTRRSDGRLVGYFFLRCFFIGRAFHGLIVDEAIRGSGAGRAMWRASARICAESGLRMFATLSRANAASLASAQGGTAVRPVRELANGYLLIECKPKPNHDQMAL